MSDLSPDQVNRDDASVVTETGQMKPAKVRSSFTFRAFFVGTICSLIIAIGEPYGSLYLRASYLSLDFSTAAAVFVFFILVGLVNSLLGFVKRSFALRPGELLVAYVMMIVATTIPTMGLMGYLLPTITGAFYYATPENNWSNLILPHIPKWMVPTGAFEVTKRFYEGLNKGETIPWGAWVKPLIYWGAFIFALYFVMICVVTILRKQWVDRERLIYPIVHVPLEMVKDDEGMSRIKPFFKNPIMWVGFSIPLIIGCLKALHNYNNLIPLIDPQTAVLIFRNTISLTIALSFPMLGFSYFINTDIALGIWAFFILVTIERGIFSIFGIYSTEKLSIYGNPDSPYIAHQGKGAMVVMVLFGLWVARGHLKDVFRKAFRGDSKVDDSEEILSYRTAVFGLIGGILFMAFWLWQSGMPPVISVLFVLISLIVFLGLTRIVAEGGVAAARASAIPADFIVSGMGSSVLGTPGLVSVAFTYIWAADIRTFVMASAANGLKLGEEIKGNKRGLFWAMMLGMVLGVVGSAWGVLYFAYRYGGINLNGWFFVNGPPVPFDYITPRITTPTAIDIGGWLFTFIGAGTMVLLMIARQRLLWWPLHPLGFITSAESLMTGYIWFSVFLAWLIKSLVLKYGGPKVYRATRPFFLGMILGQFVVAGVWIIIDSFTGMTDNNIYWV